MRSIRFMSVLVVCLLLVGTTALFANGQEEMAGGEGVALQAWINDFNPDSRNLMNDVLIPEFQQMHPNITIEMQFVGWGNHSEKYLTAWAGGEVPDIFEPALEQAAEMIAKDQAIALDDYVDAWDQIGDFYPVGYEPYMQGGSYYSIPFRLDIRNIYYRKDLLAEAGFDPEEGPQTWEDLRDMAIDLTIRDGQRIEQEGFNVEIGNFGAQQFVEFVWQNGGELLSEDSTRSLLDTPEVLEAAEFLADLYQEIRPEGTAQLPQSPIPYFATGQRAMEYGGAGIFRDVLRYAPEEVDNVGVALPLMREQRVNNVFGGGFAISSASEHPDESWEWIEFFSSTDVMARYAHEIGSMPARREAVEYEAFQHPVLQQVLDSAQYGKIYLIIPAWWEMLGRLGDQLELAYNGRKSPEEAMADAHAAWTEILNREN
ncbi:MAG: ABC transporter substrate-binding protein [bacterium]